MLQLNLSFLTTQGHSCSSLIKRFIYVCNQEILKCLRYITCVLCARFDKPKLELLGKLESTLTRLNVIWEEVGITAEVCREREVVVFRHLMNLLDDMGQEEESMRTTLLSNIRLFQEEIIKLHTELSLPPYEV